MPRAARKRAAVFDLDRTLLKGASGPVLSEALIEVGVLSPARRLPGEAAFYRAYELFGETLPFIALARASAAFTRGWPVAAVRQAAAAAAPRLAEMLRPYAAAVLAESREEGMKLLLATTTPRMLVEPFSELVGFDGVVATDYVTSGGRLTGRIEGRLVWGPWKRDAVAAWSEDARVGLEESHAYSDSVFDVPLLMAVGNPHAVSPDVRLAALARALRWPVESWQRPEGVPALAGKELYHFLRPLVWREALPFAEIDVQGSERVPRSGGVILAANHRSYFDVVALAMLAREMGRPVRFLAKRELFDAPVVGQIARALGGIPVERGSGSPEPLRRAARALRAGEVVVILPQGTIPRGAEFFDPVLRGRTGVARLASMTKSPVVPVGIAGTEAVWPRARRMPVLPIGRPRPKVSVVVGEPIALHGADARADTDAVMEAIVALLPQELRRARKPSAEELAMTLPPGSSDARPIVRDGNGRRAGRTDARPGSPSGPARAMKP